MQAAAANRIAVLPPAVGKPASAPVASAITFQAAVCNSAMVTKLLLASSIAKNTSGGEREPPIRVRTPAALMAFLTPRALYGSFEIIKLPLQSVFNALPCFESVDALLGILYLILVGHYLI